MRMFQLVCIINVCDNFSPNHRLLSMCLDLVGRLPSSYRDLRYCTRSLLTTTLSLFVRSSYQLFIASIKKWRNDRSLEWEFTWGICACGQDTWRQETWQLRWNVVECEWSNILQIVNDEVGILLQQTSSVCGEQAYVTHATLTVGDFIRLRMCVRCIHGHSRSKRAKWHFKTLDPNSYEGLDQTMKQMINFSILFTHAVNIFTIQKIKDNL